MPPTQISAPVFSQSQNGAGSGLWNGPHQHFLIPAVGFLKRYQNLVSFASCLLAGGLLSISLGADTNWDLQNYHLYNAYAYLTDRLNTDTFAAGVQTYFSPLLDVPYFLLVTSIAPASPRLIAFLMGLPYGAFIFLTYLVSWLASGGLKLSTGKRCFVSVIATVLGASGVAAVSQAGATFNEIPVAVLTLAGVYLLLQSVRSTPVSGVARFENQILGAGLLFGLAAGLKLTAAIYAPGAALVAIFIDGARGLKLLRFATFTGGWLITFLLSWGPWGLKVFRLTGNPIFPMFNSVFHSAWLGAGTNRDSRFLPDSVGQAILYPFSWIVPQASVMEYEFADPRLAIAMVAIYLTAISIGFRWIRLRGHPYSARHEFEVADAVFMFWIISYFVWEAVFSIYRYTGPLEALSGAILIAGVIKISENANLDLRSQLPWILSCILLACFPLTKYPNLGRAAFGKQAIYVTQIPMPDRALVLFADYPTAFIAPFLAAQSSGLRFIGIPVGVGAYRRFQLVSIIKDKLVQNQDALYVTYHQDSIPPEVDLNVLGVRINYDSCRVVSTNLGSNLNICQASLHPEANSQEGTVPKYRLVAFPHINQIDYNFGIDLENVPCSSEPFVQRGWVHWSFPPDLGGIRVLNQEPPGNPVLFATGSTKDAAATGKWVRAGQVLLLQSAAGLDLGSINIQYRPCH